MKFHFYLFIFFSLLITGILKGQYSAANQANNASYEFNLYKSLKLEKIVDFKAFEYAYAGYETTCLKNDILTIIDFSKPSTSERIAVIDIKNKKVLFTTYVSHGKNSGENYATSFSNDVGSHKSSLGFYLTEKTYQGKNGYSLQLKGLEKGINDNAKKRAIVIHSASYSNPAYIESIGRLGRSYGCPALPPAVSNKIIDIIKEGSLIFIYGNDKNYISQSTLLASKQL